MWQGWRMAIGRGLLAAVVATLLTLAFREVLREFHEFNDPATAELLRSRQTAD